MRANDKQMGEAELNEKRMQEIGGDEGAFIICPHRSLTSERLNQGGEEDFWFAEKLAVIQSCWHSLKSMVSEDTESNV